MVLIIGGAYAGKRAYAEKQYPNRTLVDGAVCPREALFTCQGMDHFHAYIRRQMEAGADVLTLAKDVKERNPDVLLISDEIGYGIVPVEEDLRAYREMTGRVLNQLAACADTVIRVVCGIGTVIKE